MANKIKDLGLRWKQHWLLYIRHVQPVAQGHMQLWTGRNTAPQYCKLFNIIMGFYIIKLYYTLYMQPKTISLHSIWSRQAKRLDAHVLWGPSGRSILFVLQYGQPRYFCLWVEGWDHWTAVVPFLPKELLIVIDEKNLPQILQGFPTYF